MGVSLYFLVFLQLFSFFLDTTSDEWRKTNIFCKLKTSKSSDNNGQEQNNNNDFCIEQESISERFVSKECTTQPCQKSESHHVTPSWSFGGVLAFCREFFADHRCYDESKQKSIFVGYENIKLDGCEVGDKSKTDKQKDDITDCIDSEFTIKKKIDIAKQYFGQIVTDESENDKKCRDLSWRDIEQEAWEERVIITISAKSEELPCGHDEEDKDSKGEDSTQDRERKSTIEQEIDKSFETNTPCRRCIQQGICEWGCFWFFSWEFDQDIVKFFFGYQEDIVTSWFLDTGRKKFFDKVLIFLDNDNDIFGSNVYIRCDPLFEHREK